MGSLTHCFVAEVASDDRILAVYLLGSADAGRLRAESDIDIAELTPPGIQLSELDRAGSSQVLRTA